MNDSVSLNEINIPLGNSTIEVPSLSNSTAATQYTSRTIFKVRLQLIFIRSPSFLYGVIKYSFIRYRDEHIMYVSTFWMIYSFSIMKQ